MRYSKPFTQGEVLMECTLKTAKVLCPEKVKTYKDISVSRNILNYRANKMKVAHTCVEFLESVLLKDTTAREDISLIVWKTLRNR